MQHLDEGTIHSWLDGALSADEAARVEAHVKECPQCASAVAEARGFIAASSRILTALDHAPRGVVPIATPRRRVDPLVWRVAATVLVVAAGTLVVVRTRGADEQLMSAKADRVTFSSQPTAATEQAPAAADQATAPVNGASAKPAASNPPAIALSKRAGNENSRYRGDVRENKALTQGLTATTGQTAGAPSRVSAVAAMDAAAEAEPLRVVGTPRRIGAKITLYEVAPGDTVTLTESVPLSLQQVVVTGGAVAPMARRATEKSAAALPRTRADAATTVAPDSQRAAGAVLSAPIVSAPAPSQQEVANAIHTIMWTDPATGNTLSLTGRMPEARLQEIRIRIERERAAAANKNP
jgi:putative zinc finger protein